VPESTSHHSDVFQPAWCPNGRCLAYARRREERGGSSCWLVVVGGVLGGRGAVAAALRCVPPCAA
jgi:hypothetical protein